MKAITTLAIISLFSISTACQGQTKQETTTSKTQKSIQQIDTTKQMNALDEQTKIYNQVFTLSGSADVNPLSGSTNYLELIDNSDISAEQKAQLREFYDIYDTSLDANKKAELKLKVTKMLQDTMNKSQSDLKN